MTANRRIHIDRRFAATLLAAWVSVAAGVLLQSIGLLAAGVLLGVVVAAGAVVPARPAVTATFASDIPRPTEGDEILIEANLHNRKRAVLLEWKLRLPDVAESHRGETHGLALLHARGKTNFTSHVRIQLFGLHRVGPIDLRIGDPFGFTYVEETIGTPCDVQVYPHHDSLRETVVRSRQQRPLMGRYEITQPGYGMEFYGLRGYVHGDRPRDINWKATARAGTVIVNQHERETNTETLILVDTRAGTLVGNRLRSPFAQGCRAALSLADAHMKIQDPVKFVAYGDGIHTDRHTGAVRRMQGILDILVGLEPAGSTPLGEVVHTYLPRMRPHTPVFVISPLVGDESVREALILLKSHGFPTAVFVPVPEWSKTPSIPERVWQRVQDEAIAGLRGAGMPVVRLEPGQPVEQALVQLQVMR